jgi:hypothetical protein
MAEWSPASPVNEQDSPDSIIIPRQRQRRALGKLEIDLWKNVATVKFLHFSLSHDYLLQKLNVHYEK